MDPCDFTKWDVLDLQNAPLPAQQYDAADFRALRSAHAGLLLCFMSPIVEAAFPEVALTFEAGFQECYGVPVTVEAVRRYQTVGSNAFTPEKESWFNSTYEYLESLLDDNGRERRSPPPKKRVRVARGGGGCAGGDGPAASQGPRTARSSLSATDQPVVAPQLQLLLRMTRTTRLSSDRIPEERTQIQVYCPMLQYMHNMSNYAYIAYIAYILHV